MKSIAENNSAKGTFQWARRVPQFQQNRCHFGVNEKQIDNNHELWLNPSENGEIETISQETVRKRKKTTIEKIKYFKVLDEEERYV